MNESVISETQKYFGWSIVFCCYFCRGGSNSKANLIKEVDVCEREKKIPAFITFPFPFGILFNVGRPADEAINHCSSVITLQQKKKIRWK